MLQNSLSREAVRWADSSAVGWYAIPRIQERPERRFEMDEWQPARLRNRVHPVVEDTFMGMPLYSDREKDEQNKKIFHVRIWDNPHKELVAHYRARGCDSKRFFLIKEIHNAACEHEVVTD
jgi:hypothetical protein